MAVCAVCDRKLKAFGNLSIQPVVGQRKHAIIVCDNCFSIVKALQNGDISAYYALRAIAKSTEQNPLRSFMRDWRMANPFFSESLKEYKMSNKEIETDLTSSNPWLDRIRNYVDLCLKCNVPIQKDSSYKVTFSDGVLCPTCYCKMGYSWFDTDTISKARRLSYRELLKHMQHQAEIEKLVNSYEATYEPAPYAKFNDRLKTVLLSSRQHISYRPEHFTLFSYDQISDYDLLEDGSSIMRGGLGRAVIGGFLFGGAGAVVGAATRNSKSLCTRLQIKLTVKDYDQPAFFITLIDSEVSKSGLTYQTYIQQAESIISKLQLIMEEKQTSSNENQTSKETSFMNTADQIRSFKALLDEGIITQEEFEAKKKQLLGI